MKKALLVVFWIMFSVIAFMAILTMGIIGGFLWLCLIALILSAFVWLGKKVKRMLGL